MKKFQEMCQEEFEKIELMARGGQKIVFDGVHNSYGETVIKLYFQLNDPRSLREIQIERDLNLSMVPKIYETGTIEYEGTETLYIIEQKVKGTELRKVLESGKRFSLEEAVTFLEQGLEFIACIENNFPGFWNCKDIGSRFIDKNRCNDGSAYTWICCA